MRLKARLGQRRRGFRAVYQCEHCDTTVQGSGYDDESFLRDVLPSIACPVCKKTADPATPKTAPDVPAHVAL